MHSCAVLNTELLSLWKWNKMKCSCLCLFLDSFLFIFFFFAFLDLFLPDVLDCMKTTELIKAINSWNKQTLKTQVNYFPCSYYPIHSLAFMFTHKPCIMVCTIKCLCTRHRKCILIPGPKVIWTNLHILWSGCWVLLFKSMYCTSKPSRPVWTREWSYNGLHTC